MSETNPLHYDDIDTIGDRCGACTGELRDKCNLLLNATVAVQEMSTDCLAQGKPSTNDDPNNRWVKHELSEEGCEFTSTQVDGLIATVSSDTGARAYFRGVGEIEILGGN